MLRRSIAHLPLILSVLLQGMACPALAAETVAPPADDADFRAMLARSLRDRGGVTVQMTLQQDAVQAFCSRPLAEQTASERAQLQAEQARLVRLPAGGHYLGDWREGEKIAQNGRGLQFSDNPRDANGGNCYACHQLNPQEPAYGNLGPSLRGYGTLHGISEDVLKATWTQLYNPQAVKLCAMMPRFGHQGILTERQLQDVMALLLDPASPVNR